MLKLAQYSPLLMSLQEARSGPLRNPGLSKRAQTWLINTRVAMLGSWKPLSGDWLMGADPGLIWSFDWPFIMLDDPGPRTCPSH